LTNISYQWSGKTAQEYKEHKGLTKNDNLRDHMTRTEMLLTGLSEEAGTEIARTRNAKGFNEIQTALVEGAEVAKQAKEVLEEKTGKPVVNSHNRLTPRQQALRDRAYAQQKLGYNKKNK
jgi:hypothetical protein